MKKLLLKINTTTGEITGWDGLPYDAISIVNGDTVAVCAWLNELLTGDTLTPVDLTGALALRATLRQTRDPTADMLGFQDDYNQGTFPAGEDLSEGLVTWQLSLDSSEVDDALEDAGTDNITAFLELTWLDPDNVPQTLAQIPLTIYQQLDDGAEGTPTPESPTYLTATEILALGYKANPMTAAGDLIIGGTAGAPARLAKGTAGQVLRINSGATAPEWAANKVAFCVPCSDEATAITTGTAKVTFRMPFAMKLTELRLGLGIAATGATLLTVDVNEAGTTILSTKLTTDAGEKTSVTAVTPAVISDSDLANDAEMTVDFDAIGSTVAGAGVKLWFIGYEAI
jgi:hypothetical protein